MMLRLQRTPSQAAVAILLVFIAGSVARATTYFWVNGNSGNWEDVANWTPDTAPGYPDSSSHGAWFNGSGTNVVDFNISQTGAAAPTFVEADNSNVTLDLNGNTLATTTLFIGLTNGSTTTFHLTGG